MATYIEGATKCPLCNLPVDINDKANTVHFEQFIVNKKDPLYIFNDAICHKEHFEKHPLHDAVINRIAERNLRAENERCYISSTAITIDNYKNPANLIFIDKLVDDPAHPLYDYNYRYINKYYLPEWNKLDAFKRLLHKLSDSGVWGGDYLTQLLVRLDSPLAPAWDAKMIQKYKERFEENALL